MICFSFQMAREGKVFNEDSASTTKSPEDQKESEKTQRRSFVFQSEFWLKGSVGAGLKFGQDILKFDNGWLCHLTED